MKIFLFFRTAGSVVGSGLQALLNDWDQVLTAAGGLSLLALGVYTAKGTTSVAARFIEARLGMYDSITKLYSVRLGLLSGYYFPFPPYFSRYQNTTELKIKEYQVLSKSLENCGLYFYYS